MAQHSFGARCPISSLEIVAKLVRLLCHKRNPDQHENGEPSLNQTEGMARDVDRLSQDFIALWNLSSDSEPSFKLRFDSRDQRRNTDASRAFLSGIESAIGTFPTTPPEQTRWRARIGASWRSFCKTCLGYSDELIDVMLTDANVEATRQFVRRARDFDGHIEIADLHQALRNVWVMNSVQWLLELDVTCSSSVFAYSMLYPYTDNYLDDASLSHQQKAAFNRWLEGRLRGAGSTPPSLHESSLSDLVSLIEEEHDRRVARDVYDSLLAIHRAQTESLRQQAQQAELSERDLLQLSVRKGGTSVLAHGYLVNQTITRQDAELFFGYGVFLQLLDDLQDVAGDHQQRHATLFTETSRREPLDRLTSRVYHFMQNVLSRSPRFACSQGALIKELIERNCELLMLQAIAQHPELYTAEFLRRVEEFSPWPFSYLQTARRRLQQSFHRAQHAFAAAHPDASVYDVLG